MIIRNATRSKELSFGGCKATFKIDPWTTRIDVSDRFGKRGVGIGGDEEPKKRMAVFNFDIKTTQDQDFFNEVNDWIEFFNPIQEPFYLEDSINGKRAEVRLEKFDPKFKDGHEYRFHSTDIRLVMIDSSWESLAENTTTELAMISGATLNITNSGYLDSYPIIELSALAPTPDVTIRNTTTGASTLVSSSSFVPGTTMTIDHQRGTIKIGDIDISSSLFAGGFWFFSKGSNTFQYESPHGPCDVVIKFREAYPF